MALTLTLFVIDAPMFQFSIVGMTLISLASPVFESTVPAAAIYWWELYLGSTLGFIRDVIDPMSRALLLHAAPATKVATLSFLGRVKDLLFIHPTGFIGGAKNKETGLAMAVKNWQWPRKNGTAEKQC
uniref:Uncharacterized protein n=1 Tax=Glossina palpalis gambiensis TaxID=67801 RepID=A0A1B0C6G0_9MUSC